MCFRIRILRARVKRALTVAGWALCVSGTPAQDLFTEEGQVFAVMQGIPAMMQYDVDVSNGAIRMRGIRGDIGVALDAIGYRRTDRLIYGLHPDTRYLYTLDATGNVGFIGSIGLDPAFDYMAGDISPDGRTYLVVASANGADRRLLKIDLASPGYPAVTIGLPGITEFTDLAFDPVSTNLAYGYDALQRTMVRIDINTLAMTGFTVLPPDDEIQSVFFDAFGTLYAFGTANGGVAGAVFRVDRNTGVLDVVTTGPVNYVRDLAGIPYSVEVAVEPLPRVAFPCNEVTYLVSVANRTEAVWSDLTFQTRIPPGFTFKGLVSNPFGGSMTYSMGTLSVSGMKIPRGIQSFAFKVEVGDVPEGKHFLQGELSGMPARYGTKVISNDPLTPQLEDPTHVRINRVEQDSITLTRFLCVGDSMVLDGSPYGSQVYWNTGSSNLQLTVGTGGQYVMHVLGGCQSAVVIFNVTAATCPFTVTVHHEMLPPETLPCSEVVFSFLIDNDTGIRREGLSFADTLPPGMEFVAVESNPFGGHVDEKVLPEVIMIHGMSVPVGAQRLQIRIAVGDIPPGTYRNQAILRNLPVELGPFRYSDDPDTPELDSTPLIVLGVETDTLYVDEIICEGSPLILDGTPFGIDHHWFDMSTESTVQVDAPGLYELVVFDGCEPTYVFFRVQAGERIDVKFDSVTYHIRLGDSLMLRPEFYNTGQVLDIRWQGPLDNTVSCLTCPFVTASPVADARYQVYAANEHCADSAVAMVLVDNTRHLFVPNIFTPNFDGINDAVSVYSPDYGYVESFVISDRWGNILYHRGGFAVNDQGAGWDGRSHGNDVPSGTYLWSARIRFLDGVAGWFSGSVSLIR